MSTSRLTESRPRAGGGAQAAQPDPGLHAALLESRQRWRDFAQLSADLVFETDADGRFTFYAPDPLFDWPAGALLGQPARLLLVESEPDPFMIVAPRRDLRLWLRHAGAGQDCFSVTLAPLRDARGGFLGLRGTGRNVTTEALAAERQAAALRRAQALGLLARKVRGELLAPRMLATALEALPGALGATGAAILGPGTEGEARVLHAHGAAAAGLLAGLPPPDALDAALLRAGPAGESLALLPLDPGHALLAWREAPSRRFDPDDMHLLGGVADLLAVALAHHGLQRALESQARTDPLTGLSNRRAFFGDLAARLAAPDARGALIALDLDGFKPLNDRLGHAAGDAALVAVARLLRESVRAGDLVARLGGDEFALWLTAADSAAATTRADQLCAAVAALPLEAGLRLCLSAGCAVRRHGSGEPAEALLARADAALYAAKRGGRGRCAMAPAAAMIPA